jgi:hypothetical protein
LTPAFDDDLLATGLSRRTFGECIRAQARMASVDIDLSVVDKVAGPATMGGSP